MKRTYNCFFCNQIKEEEDPIEVRCSIPGFKLWACGKCVKKLLMEGNRDYIYHDGIVWTKDSRQDIRCCGSCGKLFIPSESSVKFYEGTQEFNEKTRCFACAKKHNYNEVYCIQCKGYHKKGEHFVKSLKHNFKNSYGSSSGNINFVGMKDSKSWQTNGTETLVNSLGMHSTVMKSLPFQDIRELPENIINEIDKFYGWYISSYGDGRAKHYTTHYNFRDDINITGELNLRFGTFEQNLRDSMFHTEYSSYCFSNPRDRYETSNSRLKGVKSDDLKEGKKQNKYRNMYFDSIDDDGYVVWKYIDIFGNERTKKESVNIFYQAQGLSVDNNSATMKLKYVLSSNLKHKLDAFLRNDIGNFNSCQRHGNSDGLARGAYDTITNGCVCPILIYKTNDLSRAIGRITTRIMYDDKGEMYILLERLYHDGSFSKQIEKGEVYKQIILDLKRQGYNVIVSNYSAHDNSTLNYVESLGLSRTDTIFGLYQPLRRLFRTGPTNYSTNCGYYADGGTECLTDEINGIRWTTDHLDKAYLL